MAERDIALQQLDANGKWIERIITPTATIGTIHRDSSGFPATAAAPGAISDLGVFTDPPTAGEMATLRTTVNSILAALRTAKVIQT